MLMTQSISGGSGANPLSALRARWRDHEDFMADGTRKADIRLGLAASFTANTIIPFIGSDLLEAGFLPEIRLAPYNHIFQACLHPASHLGADCNGAIILWRIEDLMLGELAAFTEGDGSALGAAAAKTDHLADAIIRLRRQFKGTVIVSAPPFPTHGPCGFSSLDPWTSPAAFHAAIATRFKERLTAAGILFLDLDMVQSEFGVTASLDWRQWYLYRQPFRDGFLRQAAGKIARMIATTRRAAKKCIVLDADNTLWGGVIGEDGLDGIALGNEFPGSAFRDFQRHLLHLRSKGTLLAVLSKNNEADIWEVFDRHDGMVLKPEHISAWAVNWDPKEKNLPAIARTLNIGMESLVFVDDSAMEIAQMRHAWPDVTSVQLPEEPAEIVPFMQSLTHFDGLSVTEEDQRRADMMRAERAREALGTLPLQDFQRALDLKIRLAPAAEHELGRVTQLINKTNQFNLTTIRRTIDEVRQLSLSPRHLVYVLKVQDKFGDYGLTGVIVIDREDAKNWIIDTLLLSCRVLGRGVEKAALAALAEDARAAGARTFTARFIPTAKNAPAGSYLSDQGFIAAGGQEWRVALADVPALDASIERS